MNVEGKTLGSGTKSNPYSYDARNTTEGGLELLTTDQEIIEAILRKETIHIYSMNRLLKVVLLGEWEEGGKKRREVGVTIKVENESDTTFFDQLELEHHLECLNYVKDQFMGALNE